MKHSKKDYGFFLENLHYVSSLVLNYQEGFHLAATNCDVTDTQEIHARNSFDVIERVFEELNLDSLDYDIRQCYTTLWFNYREVMRIADEVRPHITYLNYQYRLKDHRANPDRLDPLFDELFTLIGVDDSSKGRFKASVSTIMTQVIRDILRVESNRARFSLVLYGYQGCGKSTFNSTLCRVMTGKDVHLQKKNLYNSFDSEEILNPVFRVEDLNYNFRDVIDIMKTYITNIEETTINVKYKPEQRVVVRTTPLLDTNNNFVNIIKTDGEQRRFCIFELVSVEKVKSFEKRLEDILTQLFQCHTTEYYYDLDELMAENLRLTDTAEEFISFLEKELYPDCEVIEFDGLPWDSQFTERSLKSKLKKTLTEFDPNDDFLPDHLYMRIQKRYFYSQWSSDRKTTVFTLKPRVKPRHTGFTGKTGNLKNSIEEIKNKTFFRIPYNPCSPFTVTDIPQQISFDQYLLQKRDERISSIIHNHFFYFYDDNEEKVIEEEVEEVTSFPELTLSPISSLYFQETVQDPFNTEFPSMVPLRNLKDFKGIVGYDNVGSLFTDHIAKNENFQAANVLLVDVDSHNGEDLSNIGEVDKLGLEYFRVNSKSGKGYHFYFPLSHEVIDTNTFATVMNHLMEDLRKVGIEADKACRNPSRKFFGTSHLDTAIHHEGVKFNVIEALNKEKKLTKKKRIVNNTPKKLLIGRGFDENISPNQALTDSYFQGNVNSGKVVKDLPHIINYLLTLEENEKDFYSPTTHSYYKVSVVIEEIKEAVSYDKTHVQFIDTLIDRRRE